MTAVLTVVAVGLLVLVAAMLVSQRRLAVRLVRAGQRLAGDVVPTGNGLAEATSVVERGVDRALSRRSDVSLAEARLATSLSVIPQGVVVYDLDGAVVYRNKVAARYLSARHSEALIDEAIHELAELVQADDTEAPTRTVDLFGPPRRTLVLKAVRLEHRSEDLGALVLIDDITGRRRLEAIRRDFVTNISHELKTPVGALGLLAETMSGERDPEVAQRLAGRMMQEAFRVARTIDDLLELSRIEADPDARYEDLAVGRLIAEAIERVAGAAAQQTISIDHEAPPSSLSVAGDRRQLVSAIYNLLDNAVKYSDPGSSVSVGARSAAHGIEVSVADHGVGIPRRDLERVFERFYRVDRARSRETGGTGLGLAIVRHIAENHGGSVRVDSTEGTGSTFTLSLPGRASRASIEMDGR